MGHTEVRHGSAVGEIFDRTAINFLAMAHYSAERGKDIPIGLDLPYVV